VDVEDGKKEVSKYRAESIEKQSYRNLFEEITKCGMRDWKKIDGKYVPDLNHPVYPSYLRLDFIHLFDFLIEWISEGKHRRGVSEAKAKERRKYFRNELNKRTAGLAEVFRLGKNRNIQYERVKIGVQTAAELLDIELIYLLDEFIRDCESKKIRLLSHSEYEIVIENFLLEAPRLVAQLQSKSLRPITPDKQEQQLPEQTVTESRYRIERVEGEGKWLDPYNFDELPLVGREKECQLLNKFIEADSKFKTWAIAGPSGSGKTRLVNQWAYDSEALKGWDCRVLHKEDRFEPKKWLSWSPDRPTLIVIDYMYGFEKIVLKLMSRRLEPSDSKVRLLLLDHVFSEPLHSDKRWGFSGDGSSLNRNEDYFFDLKPLDLRQTQDQEIIIKSIIAHRAGIDKRSYQVDEANTYLQNTHGAYHPLFAALVGDAIKSGQDFKVWNRRELIDYYLSGDDRLPWRHEGITGRWASHFIAVATVRNRMSYRDLITAAGNCTSTPEHFFDVKEICQKVISDDNDVSLAPFEPDIFGESFFLKFLQFLENSPTYQKEFREIFMAGNEDTQIEDATEFIAFIQRLTRNLLNDDQSQKETRALWDSLFDFMSPTDFIDAEPIQWGVTAGLIGIVDAIQDQFPEKKIATLLNKIEPNILYHVKNEEFLAESVLHSMPYIELMHKFTEIPAKISEVMFALFYLYSSNKFSGETLLMMASSYGFNRIINGLLDYGAIKEATLDNGLNSIMIASMMGHTETVKCLLNAGLNSHTTDKGGFTAFIWASAKGHIETIRLLLDKEAKIDAADNKGRTALIWASANGHIEAIRLLLDKKAKIDAADNEGHTALIWASANGHIEAIRLLLDKKAKIDAADNEGRTALIWASGKGHIEITGLLLDKGAEINATDKEKGRTALISASINGYAKTVKLLLDKGAYIDVTDKNGLTALIWAINSGGIEVVKLLLDKGAEASYIALMSASISGHIEMVKLLLDKGAKIDVADIGNCTPLMLASEDGHREVVNLLLNKGAEIDAYDKKNGRTALIWASANGHIETVRLLLDKEAKIDAADNEGRTALIWASVNGHIETVKLLSLEDEGQINITDRDGRTALMWVSIFGHSDTVSLLLEKDAEIDVADAEGLTALMWASGGGHIETVRLLLDKEAKIDAADNEGCTALMWACLKNDIEVVKQLLKRKARVNVVDNKGQTALSISTANEYKEIIQLLVDHGAQN